MPNTFLKSTFRQPIHVLLLFLLISSISFVFISRTAEHLIVQRETERLGGYFRSIGSLQPLNSDEYEVDITEAMALIEQSAFVEFGDKRRYGSSVLEGIYNADVDGTMADKPSSYTGRLKSYGLTNTDVFFYGELTEKAKLKFLKMNPEIPPGKALFFEVDTVVAGYPEYIQKNMEVRVIVYLPDTDVYNSMEIGQRYFIRARYEFFSTAWNRLDASQNLYFMPLTDEGPRYLNVPFEEFIDFNSPDLETLRKEIELVQENQRTMLVIATADMSAMPLMQESARWRFLTEGRWINRQDNLMANKVCAVHDDFAEMRGLVVGDSISLTLRSLKGESEGYSYFGYITSDPDRENWQNYPTAELICEIVGLYSQMEFQTTVMSNYIYIPTSIYNPPSPVSDVATYPTGYSFVLKSSRDEEAFIQENQQAMTDLGLKIVFVEHNGVKFWNSVDPLRRSALTSILIFGVALVIALLLAVFLYLRQRQRDFAILRALGVPKRTAILQNMFPISLIGGLGIVLGGSVSWRYSLNNASETLSTLPTPAGEMPSVSLDLLWLVALCVGIITLLLLFTWIGALFVARQPVLVLLQGNTMGTQKGKKSKRGAAAEVSEQMEIQSDGVKAKRLRDLPAEAIQINHNINQRKGNFISLLRYQLRQLFRSGLRSFLTVLVALGFVLALGWMQWTMERNATEIDRLYKTVVVDVNIISRDASITTTSGYGFINRSIVDAILETGFVQNSYLVATSEWANAGKMDIETHETIPYEQIGGLRLIAFDQQDKFLSPLVYGLISSTKITSIEYAPGWDESLFSELWMNKKLNESSVPAIFSTALLHMLELEYEDIIYVKNQFGTKSLRVVGQFVGGSGESTALIPLSALDVMDGLYLGYSVAEFELDPSKNRELPIFRQEVEAFVEESKSGYTPFRVVIWDEELRAAVAPMEKNLSLMAILYPATIILSVLIAVGFSFFLVMQNAKDAAILRVLGTTKLKVRALFSGEQALLSLIGLVLGLAILAIIRRDATVALSGPALLSSGLYFAGVLLGSLIGANLITRQKPLELLQVKE